MKSRPIEDCYLRMSVFVLKVTFERNDSRDETRGETKKLRK